MDREVPPHEIVLMSLEEGCPALTPDRGRSLAEAAAVCLESVGHGLQADLFVNANDAPSVYTILRPDVTQQMRLCYNDPEEATEQGACAVAILLVRGLTGLTIVEQSRKGTGFDYWLGSEGESPFQNKARLEVSGIRVGDESTVKTRVGQKLRQARRSDALRLPAYVVVVLFSRPMAQVVAR